jgi:hypothetical protein
MRRLVLALLLTAGVAAVSLDAQQSASLAPEQAAPPTMQTPAAPPAAQGGRGQSTPPAVQAPSAPQRPPSLTGTPLNGSNIRLTVTISDNYGGTTHKKTVSIVLLSGESGMIRTANTVEVNRNQVSVRLNVDAHATAYPNGLVSTRLTVNYVPSPSTSAAPEDSAFGPRPATLEESITVVLADGKPLVLTESADPVTDRKVTLEATATILK